MLKMLLVSCQALRQGPPPFFLHVSQGSVAPDTFKLAPRVALLLKCTFILYLLKQMDP